MGNFYTYFYCLCKMAYGQSSSEEIPGFGFNDLFDADSGISKQGILGKHVDEYEGNEEFMVAKKFSFSKSLLTFASKSRQFLGILQNEDLVGDKSSTQYSEIILFSSLCLLRYLTVELSKIPGLKTDFKVLADRLDIQVTDENKFYELIAGMSQSYDENQLRDAALPGPLVFSTDNTPRELYESNVLTLEELKSKINAVLGDNTQNIQLGEETLIKLQESYEVFKRTGSAYDVFGVWLEILSSIVIDNLSFVDKFQHFEKTLCRFLDLPPSSLSPKPPSFEEN